MPRSKHDADEPDVSIMNDTPDADDPRTFEHPAAEAVRNGTLSAAQLPGGGGNVDPSNPDAQYPPGRVETLASPPEQGDPSSFVPERHELQTGREFTTTDATPDFK